MHYFQFSIGDYARDTAHLTEMEDLAYRRMLDLYYKIEGPLPSDAQEIARLVRMRSHCDCIAVVLKDFFVLSPDGYRNMRADSELEQIYAKSAKARESAKARWNKINGLKNAEDEANAMRTQCERNADDMRTGCEQDATHYPLPITHNQLPKEEIKTKKPRSLALDYSSWPSMPSDEVLSDWQSHRKNKKASNSQTAINGIGKQLHEAVKNGFTVDQCLEECVCRGWAGFKAEWMNGSQKKPTNAISHNLNGITYKEQDL